MNSQIRPAARPAGGEGPDSQLNICRWFELGWPNLEKVDNSGGGKIYKKVILAKKMSFCILQIAQSLVLCRCGTAMQSAQDLPTTERPAKVDCSSGQYL